MVEYVLCWPEEFVVYVGLVRSRICVCDSSDFLSDEATKLWTCFPGTLKF